jgi:hypothetical protein
MTTPITALLAIAVLISGLAACTSPAAAKRKYVYGYNSSIYGRIGTQRWWRGMDRAGRGGRPGGP